MANLENDAFIKRMLTGLSARTKENYLRRLPLWFAFTKMTPTQQIEKRLQDLTSQDLTERTFFENKFREYKEFLETRYDKPQTVTTMLTAVASFFGRNDLNLNLKRGDWKTTLETEVIRKFKLTVEDVKALYAHANLRDRALLLVLAQSGFSSIDVSALKIEDVKGIYEMPQTEHYFIEKPREKTNIVQATCLSYEALHDIRAMLNERNNPTEGYIFTSQTKDTKGKPIETRRINEAMKTLAEKTFTKEKAEQFKTKALRSFYNSALLRSGIKGEIKDVMMGHKRLGARKSYAETEKSKSNRTSRRSRRTNRRSLSGCTTNG
jgi:integrase